MRRTLLVMACALAALCGGRAQGAIVTGQQIKIDRLNNVSSGDSISANNSDPGGNYVLTATYGGRNGGGEFIVTQLVPGGEVLKTFCLEKNEFIGLPGTYYVSVDVDVIGGGGGPNPDPLDNRTKWLYYWYVNNLLDTIVVGSGGDDTFKYESAYSANELQEAIWNIEQESSTINGLAAVLKSAANAAGAWDANLGTVYALNLWQNANLTGEKQSQLYFVSRQGGTGGEVPEPASIAVWSLISLVGVVAYRRRAAVRA
jgi:hypothetical protein